MAKGKKEVRYYTCERCGHSWIPRTEDPRTCPNPPCNSPYWQSKRHVPKGKASEPTDITLSEQADETGGPTNDAERTK